MKKAPPKAAAAAPAAPATLGNKHACNECGTKFYDFGKPELVCPKCKSKVDTSGRAPKESKSRRKETAEEALMEAEDVVVTEKDEAFESVDDLDSDDDVVEDIAGDDDKEDF